MSIERQAVGALRWAGLARVGAQIITSSVTLVVLRLLAPTDYGLMAIVGVVLGILGNIAELGLGASVVQAGSLETADARRLAGAAVLLNLGMGVLLASSAPAIAWIYGEPRLAALIRVASLQFACNAAMTVPQALLYRKMEFRALAGIEILRAALGGGTTLGMALAGYGVWSLVIGNVVAAGVQAALLLRLRCIVPDFRLAGLSRHLSFGGAITLSRLLWQVVYQSDALIGGRFLTPAGLGLYSVSLHFATLPMQKIMAVINQVAFPTIARLQMEPERLRRRLLDASRVLALTSVPALWGLSCVAKELVPLLMGEKWSGAVVPFRVICLIVPLRMQTSILATSLMGVGKAGITVQNALISAAVLPSCFLLGVQFGVAGLAASWAAAIPLSVLLNFRRSAAAIGVGAADILTAVRTPFLAGAVMYMCIEAARLGLPPWPAAEMLPILISLGALSYSIAAYALDRRLPAEIRGFVSALRA